MAVCDLRSRSSSLHRIYTKYLWKVGIVKQNFWQLMKDDSGVTTIEYGLITGFISMAIFSILSAMGDNVDSLFWVLSSDVQNVATGVELRGD